MKKKYILYTFAYLLLGTSAYSQYTTLLNFEAATNGKSPYGSLISVDTFLYGMTANGGINDMGTIFKIKHDGTGYVKLLDFEGPTNGRIPKGSLISIGTYLYGMTSKGGFNDLGTIFKIKHDGTGYVKLEDFAYSINGKWPNGSLLFDGTFLYGMTVNGGTNGYGTIFKINLSGNSFTKLLDFEGATNGSYPWGSLIFDGTFLYGMTRQGGTSDMGTIFKIMPNGTNYVKLLDFAGTANGRLPFGSLYTDGNFLYGMTWQGGTNDMGTIFKILPNGTSYEKLLDFADETNGRVPKGSLISDGTFLYGMTHLGGTNDLGTMFKIMPDGSGYLKLMDFAGATNGSIPHGSLNTDSTFLYGMTWNGGTTDNGVVFKYGITAGIDDTNAENKFTFYPNPTTGKINLSTFDNDPKLVSITNILGEEVFSKEYHMDSKTPLTIDISDQKSGIYFLRIGNCTERLIKL